MVGKILRETHDRPISSLVTDRCSLRARTVPVVIIFRRVIYAFPRRAAKKMLRKAHGGDTQLDPRSLENVSRADRTGRRWSWTDRPIRFRLLLITPIGEGAASDRGYVD